MFLLFYDLHCNYICGETFWSVFYNQDEQIFISFLFAITIKSSLEDKRYLVD